MSASAAATTTSGTAIALVIAGLTLAWAGDGGQPPPTTPGPDVAATVQTHWPDTLSIADDPAPVQTHWPDTLSIADDPAPVRLGMADRQQPESKPGEKALEEPKQVMGMLGPSGSGAEDASGATLPDDLRAVLREMYDKVVFRSMSPGELRIRRELDAPTECEFIETPLQDVVDTIRDYHAIKIEIDTRGLDDVGIPADVPMTRALKGVSLRTAFTLMLRELDLAMVVLDEVLLITTREEADAMVETHVYSLHRLPGFDSETVAQVIQATVCPDTWRTGAPPDKAASQNAPSAATDAPKTPPRGIIKTLPGGLVITQSQRVHDEILPLLSELERFRKSAEVLPKISEDRATP